MTSLNQRFNDQFQRWFQILIDDPDMQVRVNEDFSPLVEHEGYEQEFIGLSGEKDQRSSRVPTRSKHNRARGSHNRWFEPVNPG